MGVEVGNLDQRTFMQLMTYITGGFLVGLCIYILLVLTNPTIVLNYDRDNDSFEIRLILRVFKNDET